MRDRVGAEAEVPPDRAPVVSQLKATMKKEKLQMGVTHLMSVKNQNSEKILRNSVIYPAVKQNKNKKKFWKSWIRLLTENV